MAEKGGTEKSELKIIIQFLLLLSIFIMAIGIYFLTQQRYNSEYCCSFFWIISTIIILFCSVIAFWIPAKMSRNFKILISIFVIIMVIFVSIYIYWWRENDTEFYYKISLVPDKEGEFNVFIPIPLTEDNDRNEYLPNFMKHPKLKLIDTDYGKAFQIRSNNSFSLEEKGITGEYFYKISMINGPNPKHWRWIENRGFWVYANMSFEVREIEMEIIYQYETLGSDMIFIMNGTLRNGWQIINGSSEGSVA